MSNNNQLINTNCNIHFDPYMEVRVQKVLINDKTIHIVTSHDFSKIQRYIKVITRANKENENIIIRHLLNLTTKQYNNIKKDINCNCCLEPYDWCISCNKEYTYKDRKQSRRHFKSERHKKKHRTYLKRIKSELPTNLINLIFQYTYHFYNIADSSNVQFS